MKIFWSWQSDTPGSIGRHFVRTALLEAIAELKQPEDIDEPTTADNRESMHLDQDRQGVRGSPDLANLIFSKIEKAAVFVADVTPVATIPAQNERPEKRNMNPNVAIELGFALHALTDDRLLMVLNEHYGDRKYLPFDLAHKGGPITYILAPNPKPEESAAERHRLRRKLVEALRGFLDEPADKEASSTFLSTPASTSNAVWFDRGEPLVPESGGDEAYTFDDKKCVYLRLAPRAGLPAPIPIATLWALARQSPFGILYRQQSGLTATNRWGAVVYEPYFKRGQLRAATQFFPNGEMWCVTDSYFVDNINGKLIPMMGLEAAFREVLTRNVGALQRANVMPPYSLTFGAVGIRDYSLAIDQTYDTPYVIRDDKFEDSFVIPTSAPENLNKALGRIYSKFFRMSGFERPANLFGFSAPT